MDRDFVLKADREHVWHPYADIQKYESSDPIVVARAYGATLEDLDGRTYIDGNSSWWVASLGHAHPRLIAKLREQSESLVHCSLADITHEPAALLAHELSCVTPKGLSRVFYTDNGSGSVEAAIKVAVQYFSLKGHPLKSRFLALDGAFHGDTMGATSLGGVDVFKKMFAGLLFECVHVPFPDDASFERAFDTLFQLIEREHNTLAGIFVEPLVQGAAGMRMYSADYLVRLRELCTRFDVLLIADEVFTGYGRCGKMWACEIAGISPDILCLGKAFASLLPMGAMVTTAEIYDMFRAERGAAFYYGHTFCGHPLGAALAREVLAIYRDEKIVERAHEHASLIASAFDRIENLRGVVRTRHLGMIGAADLGTGGYLGRIGWRVYDEAKRRGAYIRPLGDTVYVCPPLTIQRTELTHLLTILEESVDAALSAPNA